MASDAPQLQSSVNEEEEEEEFIFQNFQEFILF